MGSYGDILLFCRRTLLPGAENAERPLIEFPQHGAALNGEDVKRGGCCCRRSQSSRRIRVIAIETKENAVRGDISPFGVPPKRAAVLKDKNDLPFAIVRRLDGVDDVV
jgi:hypothetical protein